MLGIKILVGYLAIGIVLNYGSIFLVWGYLYKICGKNQWKYKELYEKHTRDAVDFTPGFPVWAKFIFTQVAWPINVYNTIKCGLGAIKEVKNDKRY